MPYPSFRASEHDVGCNRKYMMQYTNKGTDTHVFLKILQYTPVTTH